jgi:hypothetical protein
LQLCNRLSWRARRVLQLIRARHARLHRYL